MFSLSIPLTLSLRFPLFRGYLLQCFLQEGPERCGGSDEGALRGGVWAAERRAETYHIEVRILAQDDRALQSGVVYLYDAVLAIEFFVNLQQQVEYLRVGVGVPSSIASREFYFHPCHREAALEHCGYIVLRALAA